TTCARAICHSSSCSTSASSRTKYCNLSLKQLQYFVLDEADEMLDRGFAPDVERILSHTPRERQTALFSATLPPWVATIAARHVREAVTIEVDAHAPAP